MSGAWVARARAGVSAWSRGLDRLGTARILHAARSGRGTGPSRAARPGLAAPRVEVEVGFWLPGAAVRLVPAALVAAVGGLTGAGTGVGVVLLALAAVLVLWPALPTVAGVVLVAGLAVLAGGADLLGPGVPGGEAGDGPGTLLGPLRLALLVVCLDAAVRTAALTPHVAWTARVEWSVLATLGRSVGRTQALVQPVLWLAVGLRAAVPGGAGPDAVRLVALVAVAVVLVLLVPGRGRQV